MLFFATLNAARRYRYNGRHGMDIETEQQLVEAAKSNQQAFGQLFDIYYMPISNYILRRVDELPAAQDITSVVFIKAWQGLPAFTWRGAPFSAWLYRIAGNEVNTYFRRQKIQPTSLDALYEATGFEPPSEQDIVQDLIAYQDALARHEDFIVVQHIILGLPIKYQEVLALRYFEKFPIKDIAAILGKNENTVKSLLKRGTEQIVRNFSRPKEL
jgi:RNA polymerase sigma-70 factor (ECF subfamily)